MDYTLNQLYLFTHHELRNKQQLIKIELQMLTMNFIQTEEDRDNIIMIMGKKPDIVTNYGFCEDEDDNNDFYTLPSHIINEHDMKRLETEYSRLNNELIGYSIEFAKLEKINNVIKSILGN